MTTRVPLTRANLLFYTRAPRRKVDRWLDEMLKEGFLDIDSDDDGEMVWNVRGAARSTAGPTRIEDVTRLERLREQVGGSSLVSANSVRDDRSFAASTVSNTASASVSSSPCNVATHSR